MSNNDSKNSADMPNDLLLHDYFVLATKITSKEYNLGDCPKSEGKYDSVRAEVLRRMQPAVRFQSTPTVEQIEAHAKAWPLEPGDEGGLWLEYTENFGPTIVRLAIIDRSACVYDGSQWQFFIGSGCKWLPLQPNGVPVGVSVEPAVKEPDNAN